MDAHDLFNLESSIFRARISLNRIQKPIKIRQTRFRRHPAAPPPCSRSREVPHEAHWRAQGVDELQSFLNFGAP